MGIRANPAIRKNIFPVVQLKDEAVCFIDLRKD